MQEMDRMDGEQQIPNLQQNLLESIRIQILLYTQSFLCLVSFCQMSAARSK